MRSCISRHPALRRIATPSLLVCLAWLLAACEAAWVTPTPAAVLEPTASTARPSALATRGEATPSATVAASTTPDTFLAPLTVTDAPIQSWTNPNDVRDLIDDGRYLWAATSGGIVRWDRDMGSYRVYDADDGLASPATLALAVDGQGRIWAGYDGLDALSVYQGDAWETYAPEEAVSRFYDDLLGSRHTNHRLWVRSQKSGWLWMPTYDGQVRAYDGRTWRSYGPYEGVRRDVAFVAVSDAGRVWAVGDGVSTVLEGYRWWEDHSLFSEIPDANSVTSVALDAEGRLWIAFVGSSDNGGGICSLAFEESHWTGHLHALNEAIPKQVHDIVVDSSGAVWLAGEGGIGYQRPQEMWRRIDLDDATVQSLFLGPSGRIWLGTSQGIWSVTPDSDDVRGPWLVPAAFTGRQVTHLATDRQDTLYLGTPDGLAYAVLSGPVGRLLSDPVRSLALGPDGILWVGTPTGLYVVRDATSPERVLDEGIERVSVAADGTAWAVTSARSLLRIGPDGDGPQPVANLDQLYGGLPTNCLAARSDGTVFLGTPLGLGVLSPDGEFIMTTVDDGLPDLDIRTLAVGPQEELWIGTANGLGRLLPDGRWTRFTTSSTEGGLRSASITHLCADETGVLWIATSAGLSVRTPDAEWSYLDLPGIRSLAIDPPNVAWLGGQGGLYRVHRSALTPIP